LRIIGLAEPVAGSLQGIAVTSDTQTPPSAAEFGPLDVILALAKNIKKLIFIPLILGAAVYGLTCLMPKTYTSVTVLNNMSSPTDPKSGGFGNVTAADVLLRTPAVLDPVAAQFLMPGSTPEDRRRALERRVSVVKVRNEQATTLSVTTEASETARKISSALIEAWLPLLKPAGSDLRRIVEKIEAVEADIAALLAHIKTLEQDSLNRDTAIALVTLYTQERDLGRELLSLKADLRGQTIEDVVLSGPTLPDQGTNPYFYVGPMIGAVAALLVAALSVLRVYASYGNGGTAAPHKLDEIKWLMSVVRAIS
jgi:hypothetical protein